MTPYYSSTLYLLGSVFKYSFDLIHFFLPKVNNSEMNSPILLDAHLPRKQNTCMSGPVFTIIGKVQTCTYFVKCKRFFFFLFFFLERERDTETERV